MPKKPRHRVTLLDTTLRDGEQTPGVTFTPFEKRSLTRVLCELGVDRLEVGSATVSPGEMDAVKEVTRWADGEGYGERIEVLTLVDGGKSIDWAQDTGVAAVNILAKGSAEHVRNQLGKQAEQHTTDVMEEVDMAEEHGLRANVYLEDWSRGALQKPEYVEGVLSVLESRLFPGCVMLTDTVGALYPSTAHDLTESTVRAHPDLKFDFHGHNDYGLATSNTLAAVRGGATGVHVTLNGLGERSGNAPLDEVVAGLHDHLDVKTNVDEKKLTAASKLVERFSGRKIPPNKPVTGSNVFTQTGGLHADGDMKGGLYQSPLSPKRFGRTQEYALGKLSGMASLEMNLQRQGLSVPEERKKELLERIVALGDKKQVITSSDLTYIVADLLTAPSEKHIRISNVVIVTGENLVPTASIQMVVDGIEMKLTGVGGGGYDAFMQGITKAAKQLKIKLPALLDYDVRIPPGGKTDALVETVITWEIEGREVRTSGLHPDQTMAAVRATEKMLNIVFNSRADG
jgi:D-citramalate synthase